MFVKLPINKENSNSKIKVKHIFPLINSNHNINEAFSGLVHTETYKYFRANVGDALIC